MEKGQPNDACQVRPCPLSAAFSLRQPCSSRRNLRTVRRDRWGLLLEGWHWEFGLSDVSSGKHFKSEGNRVQLPFKELFMILSDLRS